MTLVTACGGRSDAGAGGSSGGSSGGGSEVGTSGAGTTVVVDGGTSTTTTVAADESTAAGETTGGPFVLDVHTELVDGRLALRCNLPWDVAACMAIAGAPCDDVDGDALVDAWEDAALERLRPLRRFDEAESILDDATAAMADVGRVFAAGDHLRLYVMLGYSRDYGSCGFTAHNGDSERIALDLVAWPAGGPGGATVEIAYTAAHEGTATDHGRVFTGDDLGMLVFAVDPIHDEPRWVVFPSADKHATYASIEICENISQIPCFDEDCGPDGVDDPAAFDVLPVVVNAGEQAMPRVTDLAAVGFPGDDAWSGSDFCGGLGGTGCSSPVRDKLTIDPY